MSDSGEARRPSPRADAGARSASNCIDRPRRQQHRSRRTRTTHSSGSLQARSAIVRLRRDEYFASRGGRSATRLIALPAMVTRATPLVAVVARASANSARVTTSTMTAGLNLARRRSASCGRSSTAARARSAARQRRSTSVMSGGGGRPFSRNCRRWTKPEVAVRQALDGLADGEDNAFRPICPLDLIVTLAFGQAGGSARRGEPAVATGRVPEPASAGSRFRRSRRSRHLGPAR